MIRQSALAATFLIASTLTPALAQDAKQTLTIYTYDAFAADWGPAPLLEEGFEATCDCDVQFIATSSSIGALRRAQLEGDQTEADIILGLDSATMGEARKTDLFVNHQVDVSNLSIPTPWAADDFVPFDYGYFAFVYRKSDFPTPPASFGELAAVDGLKLAIQDPRASTPGLGLVLWLEAAAQNGAETGWVELAPQVLTMAPSWSEAYGLFLSGEADMALSYTTSPAYHLIAEEDDNFAAANFGEGHYIQVEVAGILKSSPNQDLANAFLTYLISEVGQKIIPTTNWMYPVLDIELPEGFETSPRPENALLFDENIVNANSGAWVQKMLKSFE